MKDFDFDELDRAVSSALGGAAPSGSQAPSNLNEKTELTSETIVNLDGATTKNALVEPMRPAVSTTPTPPAAAPAPASSLPTPSTPPSSTPLATRRSTGRFMDMVHSSSDMRSATRPASAPVQAPSSLEATPEPSSEKVELETAASAAPSPLESPFLPDAKVEKRPLGGPVLLDEPNEPRLEAPDEPRIEAAAELPDPIDFHAAQQENSNQEAIEEMKDEVAPEETEVSTAQEVAPEPADTPELTADLSPESTIDDSAAQKIDAELIDIDATVEPEAYGPTSITQQYKEQPSSTTESGAIFDTESYHQPLTPVAKKKSGVWIIVLIILLVLLGAGLGAAFYLYVLPML